MIDLKDLITKYPECMESAAKLKAFLTDLYPSEKARINILTAIWNTGIADEIRHSNRIDRIVISNYCSRLENEFGYSEKLSKECIELWYAAFGIKEENIVQTSSAKEQNQKTIHAASPAEPNKKQSKQSMPASPLCFFEIANGELTSYKGPGVIVVIPDSVTSIGDSVFENCPLLQDKNGFVIIRDILFDYFGNDTNVVIPDSVTDISNSAFANCKRLQSVTIPDSVARIGVTAFIGCESLQSVIIPDSVTSIGDCAFGWCNSLKSVTIPDSVTSIGYSVFYGCKRLQSVTIPDSVTSIGKNAFNGCYSLTIRTKRNSETAKYATEHFISIEYLSSNQSMPASPLCDFDELSN